MGKNNGGTGQASMAEINNSMRRMTHTDNKNIKMDLESSMGNE